MHLADADIILLLVDVSKELSEEGTLIIKEELSGKGSKCLLIANKIDKKINKKTSQRLEQNNKTVIKISAKTGEGIRNLMNAIKATTAEEYKKFGDQIIIDNKRHKNVLEKAVKSVKDSEIALKNKKGYEFIAVDLREALETLGEITGETTTDDILNNIFSNFCIGK
jgi:tRNA modification GTPase